MSHTPRAAQTPRPASDDMKRPEPSWFLDAANDQPRDLLAARYRHERSLDRQPPAGRGIRDMMPPSPFETRHAGVPDWVRDEPQPQALRSRRPPPRRKIGAVQVILGLAAVLAGGVIGYAASQPEDTRRQIETLLGLLSASEGPEAAPVKVVAADPSTTVITRKPITMASLHVGDVRGEVNSFIDLPVRLETGPGRSDLVLKIAGLPETAYLTAGRRNAARVWTLEAKDLDGLKLVVPDMGLPRIDLAVSAVETRTGELLTPARTITVALTEPRIVPASAPPPTALPPKPAPTELSAIPAPISTGLALPGASTNTMSAADALLAAGDAEGARALYQAALDAGASDAAFGMGRSFDPLVHAKYKVNRGAPDSATAVKWYEQAARAGQVEAINAIVRLKVKP